MPRTLPTPELLRRLVAFDSVSRRSNLPIADFIADYLDRPGVRLVRNPSPDGDKANLLALAGPSVAPDRSGLVLSGHMDVVPADKEGWGSDPFTLTDRGDSWVGRGTADMKGFLALAMNAFASLEPDRLRAPLALVFTYDEELGTLGAHHLVDSWRELEPAVGPLPRSAIIGEPTSLRVVRMHKGHLKLRLTLHGRSAHSGYPHLGDNAIEKAGRAIAALGELRRTLEAERPPNREHFPEVPYASLNLGTIQGGAAINVVPDRCRLEVGIRLLPGMASEVMVERMRKALGSAVPAAEQELEVLSESPPVATPEEAPIHRTLTEITGQRQSAAVSYATDAGWLGRLGLDCVLYGPGSIEVAHRPDELVPKADLERGREILSAVVERFTGAAR